MIDELSIKSIRELDETLKQSQRALPQRCGVRLGSIHYWLHALIEKGYLKVTNFKNANNISAYAYILTPFGITLKKEFTLAFLKRKQAEYDSLQKEIVGSDNVKLILHVWLRNLEFLTICRDEYAVQDLCVTEVRSFTTDW